MIPRIPQNNYDFFQFHKNNKMISLEILINWRNEIDLDNLYLIFKYLIFNLKNPIKFIYCAGINKDAEHIFHNIKVNKIKNMSLIDFTDWFETLFSEDERYLSSFNYYAFGFVMDKGSNYWKTEDIYPIYPWESNFKATFIPKNNLLNQLIKLKHENQLQKIKIIKLQQELDKLKNSKK